MIGHDLGDWLPTGIICPDCRHEYVPPVRPAAETTRRAAKRPPVSEAIAVCPACSATLVVSLVLIPQGAGSS
jgi:hypothetical protein